jgi:hypothetical protein
MTNAKCKAIITLTKVTLGVVLQMRDGPEQKKTLDKIFALSPCRFAFESVY